MGQRPGYDAPKTCGSHLRYLLTVLGLAGAVLVNGGCIMTDPM
jgi:hypothetical protein